MKNATFYLMSESNAYKNKISDLERMVCKIAAENWRSGKRILISCENKKQAMHLNEALWMFPEESFIPHSLAGEGPKNYTPIEISWPQKQKIKAQDMLISLRVQFADFTTSFTDVVDFVPYEKSLKQLARERYKAYRLAGFNINIIVWK